MLKYNAQIAHELDLKEGDVQQMTQQLCSGIVDKKPEIILNGEVECDEVYVVAGHKGQPDAVKKRPKEPAKPIKRRTGARHVGKRKIADIWHDSAWWASGYSDAGKCQ